MILVILMVSSLISALSYLYLMLKYRYDWMNTLSVSTDKKKFKTGIAIIIAARNEEKNIVACLESLKNQNYPKELFEIILIDDHSEDKTLEYAHKLNIENLKILKLEKNVFSKKKALEKGIVNTEAELIACTDADCIAPNNWLSSIATLYESGNVKFIAGPVSFYRGKTIFEKFQTLDFMGMMAITAAGIRGKYLYMCNGANLAYPKKIFVELNGFEGIDAQASGDDMLFMQKVAKKYPNEIKFLKSQEALVQTAAQKNLKDFWNQRIRWASKSNSYTGYGAVVQLLLVWIFMLMLFICSTAAFISLDSRVFIIAISLWIIKFLADFLLLSSATSYFRQKQLMEIFVPSVFLHWAYILSVGFWSNIRKKYYWKGRRLN